MSFLIILSVLFVFSTKGQQLAKETWTEVTHEVEQLILPNKKVQCKLQRLLFGTDQDTLLNVFKEYKYFHLHVKKDTDCQKLEFRLSRYPYKSEHLIGFFILKGYFIFVHNELLDFIEPTGRKKKNSYMEHKLGDFILTEDDMPCWIIEYRNYLFKLLHYPAKIECLSLHRLNAQTIFFEERDSDIENLNRLGYINRAEFEENAAVSNVDMIGWNNYWKAEFGLAKFQLTVEALQVLD